jgi:hypothetical protein
MPHFIDKRESVKTALIRREHSIRGTPGRRVWGYLATDTTYWCYSRNISEKENDWLANSNRSEAAEQAI